MAKNQSTLRTFKVLSAIASHETGVSLSVLATELNLPKSTVHDILTALIDLDAVFMRDEREKSYVIGAKVYRIGQSYLKQENFVSVSSRRLKKYATDYGLTVFCAARYGDDASWIWKFTAPSSPIETRATGERFPLESAPSGRALLAFSGASRHELLDHILYKHYQGNPVSKGFVALVEDVNKIRSDHVLIDNGQSDPEACIYVVPVYGWDGKVAGVIGAVVPVHDDFEDETQIALERDELRMIGANSSTRLGYSGKYA